MPLNNQATDQSRTYALVVGIESYDFERPHPLQGSEAACERFRQWLIRSGVPDKHIHVHVSSSESRIPALKPINQSIAEIGTAGAELVFVFWAGHGYEVDGQRCVYLADSNANGFSYNIHNLMGRFASQHKDCNVRRLIGIFDCCAIAADPEYRLPSVGSTPIKTKTADVFIWFACRIGEIANYSTMKGGEFSDVLLTEFEERAWPLDLFAIDDALRIKFEELQLKRQHPIYYAATPKGEFRLHDIAHLQPGDSPASVPIKIATTSHRGGVGKTTLAVNMALELASIATVVLVDCDISGRGATEWLKSEIPYFDDKTLTLHSFAELFLDKSGSSLKCPSSQVFAHLQLARIPDSQIPEDYFSRPMPGQLYFVPVSSSWPRSSTADFDYWQRAVQHFISTIGLYNPDFIIFDCAPGADALTTAVCINSKVGILISPFHRDDMRQAAFTLLWLQHNGAKTIQWRLVLNKLPTSEIYKETPEIFEEAQRVAQEVAFNQGLEFIQMRSIISVMIPDLEEFRDYYRKEKALSKFRRRGNVFVLCVRLLLNSLQCDGLLGGAAKSLPFMRNSSDLSHLREDVYAKFVDRLGYGKAGLQRESLIWPGLFVLLFMMYFLVFLLSVPKFDGVPPTAGNWTTVMRICELLLIGGFAVALASFVGHMRRAILAQNVFKQFYPDRIKELRLEKTYQEGGNRATTSNFWWPRVAWLLTFVPTTAFILAKWIIFDGFGPVMGSLAGIFIFVGILIVLLSKTGRELGFRSCMYVYRSVRTLHYK